VNATVLLTAVDIHIPGYHILRPVGEGGMASVFLAVQQSLDREVALKVMSPVLAANAEFASRFVVEGKITAKLQHPNLVTVYDIGSHQGVYYLAAEYIPGGTLKERIAAGGLSVGEILDIASDIAQGLDFAHQKGFVHRDVKPGNVLFRNDGRVVLADFGIAKAMDGSNSSTVAGSSIGTPDYMSPEQARGEPVDGRSDLYSLGTVLFEMLTGHPPYQASDPFTVALMHVTHPVPELPSEIGWLQPMINGLMAKLAADRFNTGAAFIDALHKLIASAPEGSSLQQETARKSGGNRLGTSSATQQRTRVSLAKEPGKRSWLAPTAIAVVLLLAVGFGWRQFSGRGVTPPGTDTVGTSPTATTPAVDTAGALSTSFPAESVAAAISNEDRDNLLAQADAYLKIGTGADNPGRQLIFPDDDSALGLYRKILAADPANARAKTGIAAIVAYYRDMSYQLCEQQLWTPCGVTARNGLAIEPGDETLIKLNEAAGLGEAGEKPTLPPKPGN
jgi:serine/threonine-protein kinase PpkA